MNFEEFFQGSGRITFKDKFISLRFIKDALEKDFKIVTQEETSKYLKCKIVRYMRLFGGPALLPFPTLEVQFNNENETSEIHYKFTSHDYIVSIIVLPVFFAFAALNGFFENNSLAIQLIIGALVVTFLAIFADTKYFSGRIKRALQKI